MRRGSVFVRHETGLIIVCCVQITQSLTTSSITERPSLIVTSLLQIRGIIPWIVVDV